MLLIRDASGVLVSLTSADTSHTPASEIVNRNVGDVGETKGSDFRYYCSGHLTFFLARQMNKLIQRFSPVNNKVGEENWNCKSSTTPS